MAWKDCCIQKGKPRPPHRPILPPPSATGPGPHQRSWEGGEGAGRSRLRRRRGGGAEEQLHLLCLPIALQAEPPEFSSVRRSAVPTLRTAAAHRFPRLPLPGSIRAEAAHLPPGPHRHPRSPAPAPGPRPPHSPPGRARQEERAEAGAGRCGLGICARRSHCPRPPPHPGRWLRPRRSCYPETEGRKSAPAARPSRRAAATAGNKGDKAASAGPGFAPSPRARRAALPPPAAKARPEAAARAGRAAPSRPGPRIPALRAPHLPRAGDSTPPCGGAGCSAAVATATQVAARRAECQELSPGRRRRGPTRPGPTHPGLTCAPRRNRNREPSWDGRGRAGGALGTHRCACTAPRRCPRPSAAPRVRQPPPALQRLGARAPSFPSAAALQLSLPELLGAWGKA